MKKSICVLAPLAVALAVGLPRAEVGDDAPVEASLDWPQWRGPNRDAVSLETGLLHAWPKDGPEEIWRIEGGEGFSSVSTSGGHLYTMWDQGGKQFLVCLRAKDGEERWRRALGAGFQNHYGNGPRSTPLVDGDVVFAVGTQGRLVAANKDTGDVIWEHDLVEDFEARLPTYGYAGSPLLVGDMLLVETGGKDAAYAALDKATGDIRWASHDDPPAYTSPIEITVGGVPQIVFWSAQGVHALSPADGTVLWNRAWSTDCPVTGDPLGCATPIFVAPDRLFLSSGSGAAVVQLVQEERGFGVRTIWESKEMRNDVNSSVVLGGHVYGFDRGTLKCLDLATGETKWKARGYGAGSLIAADGELIVLSERGQLALVKATTDAFVETGNAAVLEGKNWTTPSLAGGRLYLRNHAEVLCLDVRKR